MSWTKRILLGLSALVLLVALAICLYLYLKRPQYSGVKHVAGIENQVAVAFDQWGIPHIEAQSAEDAYFALGYTHAAERLFQMEMLRRVSKGALSEILGAEFLAVDELFLTLGIKAHSEASAKEFMSKKGEGYQETMAYLKGINHYIKNERTPLEFDLIGIDPDPFTVEDCYAISGYMAFSFALGLRTDPAVSFIARKLGPEYLKDLAIEPVSVADRIPTNVDSMVSHSIGALLDEVPVGWFCGSNGFVLSGDRSASGYPILVNDTHIKYSQPAVWYESYLSYPGHKIYGNYLPGFPFAIIGHNEQISWGMTMLEADDMDFYEETQNPNQPLQVLYKGEWQTMDSTHYQIQVKGRKEPHELVRYVSKHGPLVHHVIPELKSTTAKSVALKWVYTDFLSKNLSATYLLGKANNISEAEAAVSMIHSPPLNIMYADKYQNIAWWGASKIPIRKDAARAKLLLNGSNGEDEYEGYVAFEDNPHLINPSSGVIVTANNQPDSFAGRLHAGYYTPVDRYRRLHELLDRKDIWSPDSLKSLILDHENPRIEELKDSLLSFIVHSAQIDEKYIKILKEWKGSHELDQTAPILFYRWLAHSAKAYYHDELGDELYHTWINTHLFKKSIYTFAQSRYSPWWDNVHTAPKEDRKEILTKALEKAISELNNRNLTWEKNHEITHRHALGALPILRSFFNVGPFQMSGGMETVMNYLIVLDSHSMVSVTGGPAVRRIIDMAHPDSSWSVLPTGQSGNVLSPHFDDQAKLYHYGRYRKQVFGNRIQESRVLQLKPISRRQSQ